MKVRSLIGAVAVLLLSCENPFNPYGEYTPRLVVYSVLTNTRGPQFVRVSATNDPLRIDPGGPLTDTGLEGAFVRITGGGSTFVFRDTLLQNTHAYVCDSMPVAPGVQYSLEVSKDSLGPAQSSIVIPSAPSVVVSRGTASALDGPSFGLLAFSVGLSANTRRHRVRMFIEFDSPDSIRHRWEVPFDAVDTSLFFVTYPDFQYTTASAFEIKYSGRSYEIMLTKIVYRYTTAVKWRNVVFEVYQIGEPLENYSSVANGFKDELSLRADEPDYSNISGGFGLFGAYTVTEIARPFPPGFFFNPYPSH